MAMLLSMIGSRASCKFSLCHVVYDLSKKVTSVSCASLPPQSLRSEREVSLCIGTHNIPHPKKVDKGGEDAFFISNYNGGVLAVADGVSGWAEKDVDPSLFPRELMANVSCLLEDEETIGAKLYMLSCKRSQILRIQQVNYDPQLLIRKAHAATSSKGSATVITAMLDKGGSLKIANIGDCGLKVIRKGRIIFYTPPVEHYFDCPYQLSSEATSQSYLDAVVSSVELIERDTIVMGSDGLFDNIFDHEMVSTLANCSDVAEAAKALAKLACDHSKDSSFDSPYSLEARNRGFDVPPWKKFLGMKLTGGKLDDITVIVSRVVKSS